MSIDIRARFWYYVLTVNGTADAEYNKEVKIMNWNEKRAADVLNHMAKDFPLRFGVSPDAIGIHAMKYAANRLTELSEKNTDVVEVVRCKDCKYRDKMYCAYLARFTFDLSECLYMKVSDSDYCSWGEKK